MANRDNHYEAAFEEFLRLHGVPYVAVDEARRSLFDKGTSLKSLDFIVAARSRLTAAADGEAEDASPRATTWLIDVKGRRFPSGNVQKQYWKNWSTRDDLQSLAQWEALFGPGFQGLFVFAYEVLSQRSPLQSEELFRHRGRLYGFVAVTLADYAGHAHPISPRWDTWAMSAGEFRRFARPLSELLDLRSGNSGESPLTEHRLEAKETGC